MHLSVSKIVCGTILCAGLIGCAPVIGSYYRVSAAQGRIVGDRPGDVHSPVAITFERGSDVTVQIQSIRSGVPLTNHPVLSVWIFTHAKATKVRVAWDGLRAVDAANGNSLPLQIVEVDKGNEFGADGAVIPFSADLDDRSKATYSFLFAFSKGVSSKFEVTFPNMWVNGVFYPGFVLHYVKTSGFRLLM